MGFNTVYRALQDVFPQIDSRVLRAVAIEHSKDADLAVDVVLTEIIPHLSSQSQSQSRPVTSFSKNENSPIFSEVVVDSGKTVQFESTMVSEKNQAGSSNTKPNCETDIVVNGLSIDSNTPALVDTHNEEHMGNSGKSIESFENDSKVVGYIEEQPGSKFANIPEPYLSVTQEHEHGSSSKTASETENNAFVTEENTEDDESIMTSILTRSEQICNTELLEEIIEDARNEKKTLVSTMESVVELMKEVEEKEKAAEEAKEEAAKDCSHIFTKVDELKQALGRAKEANDMHAGEVYAEKAILATELKELQLRLFTLSDERNKSLGILNEMREGLEIRLATALKEIESAEGEKVEKQKFAREALAYQESRLEEVVEESKKLQREAEENSKLQEFLMDRGRAIDILQGEISVKCQDVRLLKEKYDKKISLSSSQTSSILSSPASSFRSTTLITTTTTAEQLEAEEMYETPNKSLEMGEYSYRSPPRSEAQSPTKTVFQTEKQSNAWKLLLNDDDWELFDKGDLATSA